MSVTVAELAERVRPTVTVGGLRFQHRNPGWPPGEPWGRLCTTEGPGPEVCACGAYRLAWRGW